MSFLKYENNILKFEDVAISEIAKGRTTPFYCYSQNTLIDNFKNLIIETDDPTAINVDGENLGTTPLEINVLPSALKVFH